MSVGYFLIATHRNVFAMTALVIELVNAVTMHAWHINYKAVFFSLLLFLRAKNNRDEKQQKVIGCRFRLHYCFCITGFLQNFLIHHYRHKLYYDYDVCYLFFCFILRMTIQKNVCIVECSLFEIQNTDVKLNLEHQHTQRRLTLLSNA